MRTKTLLIAAATLAATIISSEAQTVYSANIVGYVNQTLSGNGNFTLVVNPLVGTNGLGTNTVESLMPSLADGDTVYLWTGNGYYSSTYQGGVDGLPGPNDWIDQYNNITNSPSVAMGQGFFYSTQSGNTETNTFTGSVAQTNSIPLAGNGLFTLVGSTPPIGGSLESSNFTLPFSDGDTVYLWNGNGYYSSTYQGGPDGLPAPNDWIDQYNNITNAPTVSVGQGFFYSTQSGNAATWNQQFVLPQ